VIVHKGTQECGHYVSYCKRGRKWYLFDDAKYRKARKREVLAAEAYVLLYEVAVPETAQ
jgi:ubiquitin carboxyl-terminal hydrolase 22/27/51